MTAKIADKLRSIEDMIARVGASEIATCRRQRAEKSGRGCDMMPTLENPKLGAIVPKKHTSSRSGQLRPDNPIARVDQHSHTSRASWRRSSSRFVVTSTFKNLTPVRLVPGPTSLATRPNLTGSSPTANAAHTNAELHMHCVQLYAHWLWWDETPSVHSCSSWVPAFTNLLKRLIHPSCVCS